MKPRDNLSLSTEQQAQVDELTSSLRLLAYAAPDALTTVKAAIDTAMAKARAAIDGDASTPAAKAIAGNCATSLKLGVTDAVALKTATDARVVAGIPKDMLQILRILHGDNDAKIAHAYLDTRRLQREGKLSA